MDIWVVFDYATEEPLAVFSIRGKALELAADHTSKNNRVYVGKFSDPDSIESPLAYRTDEIDALRSDTQAQIERDLRMAVIAGVRPTVK